MVLRSDINFLIGNYCDQRIQAANKLSPTYQRLWQTIQIYLQAGGKRFRPYFMILTYQAYGGKDRETMVHVATAWELLHSSLLIHDDIIDRDYIRHGVPNIAGMYQDIYKQGLDEKEAHHYAASAALLAGDLILNSVFDFIMLSQLTSDDKVKVTSMLNEAMFIVGGGEFLDIEASILPYGAVDSALIAQQKTAHYSFLSPMLSGAMMANTPPEQLNILREFAVAVGLGYQLVDDLLGLYGEENTIGKSITSDLREAKLTVVFDEIMKLGNFEQRATLQAITGSKYISSGDVSTIRKLGIDTGAKQAVEHEIIKQTNIALELLETLSITNEFKSEFRWIIAATLERNA